MSKKVVHLSDDAHEVAKQFCKDRGVKMSDWVAALIRDAIVGGPTKATSAPPAVAHHAPPAPVAAPAVPSASASPAPHQETRPQGPRKKPLARAEPRPQTNEDGVPVYAQPPFWSRAKG